MVSIQVHLQYCMKYMTNIFTDCVLLHKKTLPEPFSLQQPMIKLHYMYINQQCIGYSVGEFYQLTVYDFLFKSVKR